VSRWKLCGRYRKRGWGKIPKVSGTAKYLEKNLSFVLGKHPGGVKGYRGGRHSQGRE